MLSSVLEILHVCEHFSSKLAIGYALSRSYLHFWTL